MIEGSPAILPKPAARSRRMFHLISGVAVALLGIAAGAALAHYRNAADLRLARQSPAGPEYGEVMASVKLDWPTLREALRQLGEQAHARLDVDWPELKKLGVLPDVPLKLQVELHDVTLDQVLPLVGRDADGLPLGDVGLGDRVFISSRDVAYPMMPTTLRIYDTRSLLADIHRRMELFPGDFFDSTGSGRPIEEQFLAKVVTDTAASDSWERAGGTHGSLWFAGGRLFVVQTAQNHQEVADALKTISSERPPSGLLPPKVVKNKMAEADLARRMADLSFNHAPLRQVIATLRAQSNANMFVNWPLVLNADDEAAVDLSLHKATLEQTLDALVQRLNAGRTLSGQLDWAIRDRIITISTVADLESYEAYVVIYPADDALRRLRAAGTSDAGGELLARVRRAIPAAGWQDRNAVREARIWAGNLIVTQNGPNHRIIARLLKQMRGGS
ncbi:MAG TPA: hypothetical protein VFE47_02445 [Tepidisphaeraceae bacterium]|jgi:hypothetical protein|nr:hypothetical protein [Tepidisphaeraceae bacterium]